MIVPLLPGAIALTFERGFFMIPEENFGYMGMRIKNRRKEMGFTQEMLAERLAVTTGHLCRVERGTRPSLDFLTDLARELQISVDELLGLNFDENPTLSALGRALAGRSPAEQEMALSLVSELFEGLDRVKEEAKR